jgi:transcriptional regulator with XRE-family HTH domain
MTEALYRLWGKNLKGLREAKNLTQEDVAKGLDTTRASVSRWESGLVMPNDEMRVRCGVYFGVPATGIFPLIEVPA